MIYGAGPGLTHGGAGQPFQGGVVVHGLTVKHAAMTMVGVFAKAGIADDAHVRQGRLDGPDRVLDRPLVVPGAGTFRVFARRQAEQQHGRYAQAEGRFGRFDRHVRTQMIAAGQAGNFLFIPGTLTLHEEKGQDEVLGG